MATGDNIHTAVAIGQQCGLLKAAPKIIEKPEDVNLEADGAFEYAMTADVFNSMLEGHKDVLKKAVLKLQVVARMKPDEKEALVHLL